MAKSLGRKLTDLLAEHYPTAFNGDPAAIGAACGEIGDVLGGLLAFAKQRSGPVAWEKAVRIIINRVSDSQDSIIKFAVEEARVMPPGSPAQQ